MVLVQAGNDAFLSVFTRARELLQVDSAFAVAVLKNGEDSYTLRAVCMTHMSSQQLTVVDECTVARPDVTRTFEHLCRATRGQSTELIFLEQAICAGGEYRREWILIEIHTLSPRCVEGRDVVVGYNPTI